MRVSSRTTPALLVAGVLLLTPELQLAATEPQTLKIEPEESQALLANPGMGWQTFHRFADEDKALEGLPSSSAYFRFYWRELEPKDGAIDFAKFDELLAHAHRAGQKLAFRVMCTGSGEYMDVPPWLKQQGCKGFEFKYGGKDHWVPDFSDPHFQKAHSRLIHSLGQRYDGHPDLDLVDIGSVGLWGEWHMSDTVESGTGKAVPLPPLELRLEIIDTWCRAFPQANKVILIGSAEGMARTTVGGLGWRADCLGDMGGFSKTWNHMDNFYLQQLKSTGAEATWKTGPVAFESCWDMRKWAEAGWDIHYIFDYALRCHASYINNKSAPLPQGTREEVERCLRSLGYRLVLRSLEHAPDAQAGEGLKIATRWENVGVAPPYREYRVAFQLKHAADSSVEPLTLVTGDSVRGWLPGKHESQAVWKLPSNLAAGRYELAAGLANPATRNPEVLLAIKNPNAGGWYPLSHIQIRKE